MCVPPFDIRYIISQSSLSVRTAPGLDTVVRVPTARLWTVEHDAGCDRSVIVTCTCPGCGRRDFTCSSEWPVRRLVPFAVPRGSLRVGGPEPLRQPLALPLNTRQPGDLLMGCSEPTMHLDEHREAARADEAADPPMMTSAHAVWTGWFAGSTGAALEHGREGGPSCAPLGRRSVLCHMRPQLTHHGSTDRLRPRDLRMSVSRGRLSIRVTGS